MVERHVSRASLQGAAAGISGAFSGKRTDVSPGAGTDAKSVQQAAEQLLSDYGHMDAVSVEIVGENVVFTPQPD